MLRISKSIVIGAVGIYLAGCGQASDKPNLTVTAPTNPAAIAVLNQIKALPDGASRRAFMNTHEKETQTLRSDPGSWVEASKLAWSDVPATPVDLNGIPAKKSN